MTQYLHPTSVKLPSQGAFQFWPEIKVFDEPTAQDLENAMNAGAAIQGQDPDNYYVVESVEYQVVVTRTHPSTPVVRYTALVHATRVEII